MPRGPTGEWRPDDPIACAVQVARIATGQIEETCEPPPEPEDATTQRGYSLRRKLLDSRRLRASGAASDRPRQRS